jgi:aryl-alcohol dehydrogenase-like predicted oxidoreductase
MEQRSLGKNLKVSCLGFGGAALSGESGGYGFGPISENDAIHLLEYAFSKGITLYDTAPIYGFRTSEKRIGCALSGNPQIRKQMTLVSKLGVGWDLELKKRHLNNSPENLKRMLEQSLVDLKTDYLDLYMIHWPDAHIPVETTMEALVQLQKEGVIKAIGVCNFDQNLLQRAEQIGKIDVVQNSFSLLEISPKTELFPFLKENQIGFMSYGSLGKGILSGSVTANRVYDSSDVRHMRGKTFEDQFLSLSPVLKKFFHLASKSGHTPAQLAFLWVLSHEEVGVVLCGAKSSQQLDELLKIKSSSLDVEIKNLLTEMSLEFQNIK